MAAAPLPGPRVRSFLAAGGVALASLLAVAGCAHNSNDSFEVDGPDAAASTDASPVKASSSDASTSTDASKDGEASVSTDAAAADASPPIDCVIGGQSYAPSAANPSDPCQVCEPSQSTTSFTQLPGNFYWCKNSCVDSLTDPNNCGGCQNVCVSGSCVNGACANQCTVGGKAYVSGAANPSNPCQVCEPSQSTTSFTQLPGNFYWCQNSCVDSLTDPKNCGACQNACASGQQCSNGGCVAP